MTVELAEARTARIVWAEIFDRTLDDAFLVLDEIGNRIVASIASEIETVERNRAILKPPNSLDAWEAHHRGLWHMYRFNKADNDQARHFFEMAVRLDPTFSRAYAGLSFTHFAERVSGLGGARAGDRARLRRRRPEPDGRRSRPGRALGHGPRALAARAPGQSLVELEQAVDLSPNFALGSLHARLRAFAGRRSELPPSRPPTIRAD